MVMAMYGGPHSCFFQNNSPPFFSLDTVCVSSSSDTHCVQQGADLETLKQSSRLVHYCATPLLFDPFFRKQIQEEQFVQPPVKVWLF